MCDDSASPASAFRSVSPTVLVIAEHAALRSMVEAALVDEGYAVTAVATTAEVLRDGSHEGPDIMVLDMTGPSFDWLDVTEFLRLSDSGAPLVVLASGVDLLPPIRAASVLSFPLDLDVLLATVARCAAAANR